MDSLSFAKANPSCLAQTKWKGPFGIRKLQKAENRWAMCYFQTSLNPMGLFDVFGPADYFQSIRPTCLGIRTFHDGT